MSIADELLELQQNTTALGTARTDIRTALAGKGVSASDHDFADFATDIGSISTGGLPSEYEAVDYIESSGTQYIDTGYIAQNGTDIDCEIYVYSDTPTWYCGFGAYSSNKAFQLMLKTSNNSNKWRYYVENKQVDTLEIYDTRIRFITFYLGAQWYNLGVNAKEISLSGNHLTDYSLGIFAGHESNGFNAGALMRCYYFKIYQLGELVRHFVPCVRKADGEAGMYDLVNGVFYTNQGTGDFIIPT